MPAEATSGTIRFPDAYVRVDHHVCNDAGVISDDFDLQRFVTAQAESGMYERAVRELQRGLKESHWMWFIFPQVEGLGGSSMARRFAITGLAEAREYLAHPVLGPRIVQCAQLVVESGARSAIDVFGSLDARKLQSSMTLFQWAAPQEPVFSAVLERFFDSQADPATEKQVAGSA